jgi:hypothetical protein
MTIHARRGSGTWFYWVGIALVLASIAASLALGLVEFR